MACKLGFSLPLILSLLLSLPPSLFSLSLYLSLFLALSFAQPLHRPLVGDIRIHILDVCRLRRDQGSKRVDDCERKSEMEHGLDKGRKREREGKRNENDRMRNPKRRERKRGCMCAYMYICVVTIAWSTVRLSCTSQRRHEVCGATILIRRWIYGLNHRRIISDSRALLPPTETYACLFADNCTQLRARPLPLPLSLSLRVPLSVSLHFGLARFAPLSDASLSVLFPNMTFPDLPSGTRISMTLHRAEKMSPCPESQDDDIVIVLSFVIMCISMRLLVSVPIVILRYPLFS